ncbi:MAG: FAD-dependent oxidoreductase [Cyanobacteriota bacterium]|nr:FAD-dependent oxidoreductase [Cyanobacteriota bacterium]
MPVYNLSTSFSEESISPNSEDIFGVIDTIYDYVDFVESNDGIAMLSQDLLGTEVAVIGAGVSGLVAAYELLKIGANPVIFEASDRIGGRAYSKHFTESDDRKSPVFAELGSMRFPPSGKLFFYYLEEVFDLPKERGSFPDPGKVFTKLYYENQEIDWKQGSSSPENEQFKKIGEDWGNFISKLVKPLQEAWKELATAKQQGDDREYEEKCAKVKEIWQGYIYRYQNVSFYQAVRQGIPSWTDEDVNKFGALGIGSGGFGPLFTVNFLEFLRLVVNGWEENQMLLPFGISYFIEKFYTEPVESPLGKRSLKDLDTLHLKTPVTSIQYNSTNHQPIVYYTNPDGSEESKSFAAVIVTTTTRSMEMMGLTLGAPGNSESAIEQQSVQVGLRNLHLTTSSKLFIRTKTKFWLDEESNPKDNIPQNIQTDELPRGVYALDYPQKYNPDNNGVVVVSYTWEDDSTKLMGLRPEARLKLCKEAIAKVSPEFAENLVPLNDEIICIDWQGEDYYYGAFKLQYPGQETNIQAAYYQFLSVLDAKIDRGVYLAGDSVSWAGGWTEGAMHTAINAACAAAQRIGAKVKEHSPLTQEPDLYYYGQRLLRQETAVGHEAGNELYNSFDDTEVAKNLAFPFLTKIVVRHGDIIDRLEAYYGDENSLFAHGGNGGQQSTFEIELGDSLTEVSGYYGRWFGQTVILQLTFKTKTGKTATYGTGNPAPENEKKNSFVFKANPDKKERIFAFHGSVFSGILAQGNATLFLGSLGVTIEYPDPSLNHR